MLFLFMIQKAVIILGLMTIIIFSLGCLDFLSKDCKGDKNCILQSNMCQGIIIHQDSSVVNKTLTVLGKGNTTDTCRVKITLQRSGFSEEQMCTLHLPLQSGSVDEIFSKTTC